MSEVPNVTTPFAPAQLVAAVQAAYCAQLGHDPTHATLAILCAHVALETGNGRACEDWDVGNFKAAASGDWDSFPTWEMVNGVRVPMVCKFAAFASLEQGVEAYLVAMYTRWTLAWSAAVAGDAEGFALGLHDQKPYPYYTADPASYVAGVSRWASYYRAILGGDPAVTEPELLTPGAAAALATEGLLDEPDLTDLGSASLAEAPDDDPLTP